MKCFRNKLQWLSIYIFVLCILLTGSIIGSRVLTAYVETSGLAERKTVIIDAGHGGEDGGAISCTGAAESQLNLSIAIKLRDLLGLFGVHTVMIRETDISVYTEGSSLSAKKVSDLKERTRIANQYPEGLLVSIHQNTFPDKQYSGAQIFYSPTVGSQELADMIQSNLRTVLQPNNHRQIKRAGDVYLMQHINCTGILVECGFLSNPVEEALLRDQLYQYKLSAVVAVSCCQYINTTAVT